YKYALSKNLDVTVKPSTTLDGFVDANKVDSWALTAVKWAVERGIISGKGNASTGYRIDPTGKATRVECAAMMNKFSEIYANAPKLGDEDLEEPLALPEEEIEDLPVPADETEDVIIDEEETEDEDVPSEDEEETDEGEINPEEEAAEE
ncbi:MAG: S-layer homology domain-containing protein, partial [Lachnospiraceae bacterium]|nr:S-layer homology domain-containing protein [Lachnospiraceae bacterium]